jgi:hypothetical protein
LVDERSLLFGKQKSKLRKLLNEYAAAVAAHSSSAVQQSSAVSFGMEDSRISTAAAGTGMIGGGGGVGGGGYFGGAASAPFGSSASASAAAGAASASILIRPDQRLSYEHLSWWFAQEGSRELPGMDQAIVERVWGHMTRTNVDGRMSVNDLKGWYISFGKRALARSPPLTAADLEKELVPTAFMYDNRGSVAEKLERAHAERERLERERLEKLKEIGRAEAAREAKLGGAGRPSTAAAGSTAGSGMTASGRGRALGSSFLDAASGPPLELPSDSFDFQLRLTEEEYKSMRLRQREIIATRKFQERIESAQGAKAEKAKEESGGFFQKGYRG